jgi:hypothetical protein
MKLRMALVVAVAACGDDDGGPVARFDVPSAGPIAWGEAPFPSDVFLGDDGTPDLAALPSTAPVWERVREDVNQRTGFCGTCPIHFPIDGELDPATLADAVVMIDPTGAEVPIEVEWNPDDRVVAVEVRRGIVPVPATQYIVALTSDARGIDGTPLAASSGFRSARARLVNDPALAALDAAGIDSSSVVSLAAFTVEDPTVIAKSVATRVREFGIANGPPTLIVDRMWKTSDGTLDELMGTPAEDRPGLDVPSVAGSEGATALAHSNVSILIKGRMSSVRVISGTGSELGVLSPDTVDGGDVPFLLAIPNNADVTNLPVMVFHHGASGTMSNGLAMADTAARAGAAMLALETFQHGERHPLGGDGIHELRGDDGTLGPDGWFESAALQVGLRLFAIEGAPADDVASPAFVAGSLSQMLADLTQLILVARDSDLSPIAATDASLTGIAFRSDQIYFAGISLGTVIGTSMLVGDDTIAAAVLDVPPGGLVSTLIENRSFRDQFELLMMNPLEIPKRNFEPEQLLTRHPLVAFMQWELHPFEPMALVPHVTAMPGRDLLWQIAGLDELAGTPSGQHLVQATGVPAVGNFIHADVTPGTAPLQGRGAWLFDQADHLMIGFNAGSSVVEAPGLPPFELRPDPLMFQNPVQDVHDQIVHFYVTHRTTGTGEITIP